MPFGLGVSEVLREYIGIDPEGPFIMAFNYVVLFSVMAFAVFAIKYFSHSFTTGFYGKSRFNPLNVIFGVLLLISWNILISPLSEVLPSAGNEQLDKILKTGVLSVITATIIAPCFEEWFFRRILISNFHSLVGSSFWSVTISAAVFALSHVYPLQVVTAFGAGIILGTIYSRTYSLLTTIMIHMLYNGIIYVIYTFSLGDKDVISTSLIAWTISAIVILCAIIYILKSPKGADQSDTYN